MSAQPLVPWIGGKRKLAAEILPLFPDHECYVEPFCGAAALFFFKQPSTVEVLNDINQDLVNLYRVVKYHFEELYSQFKWVLTSRQNFEWLNKTPADTLTDIQRAARFLYLQKLAFGGRVDGRSFGTATTTRPKFNLLTLEQDLQEVHFRLTGVSIEHKQWSDVMKAYDREHTLFYCDPPYWGTEGYGVDFPFENYVELANMARNAAGHVIISINDHPDIREVFAEFPMKAVDYQYQVGGSSRKTDCVELVIGNWRDGTVPAGRYSQDQLF